MTRCCVKFFVRFDLRNTPAARRYATEEKVRSRRRRVGCIVVDSAICLKPHPIRGVVGQGNGRCRGNVHIVAANVGDACGNVKIKPRIDGQIPTRLPPRPYPGHGFVGSRPVGFGDLRIRGIWKAGDCHQFIRSTNIMDPASNVVAVAFEAFCDHCNFTVPASARANMASIKTG